MKVVTALRFLNMDVLLLTIINMYYGLPLRTSDPYIYFYYYV